MKVISVNISKEKGLPKAPVDGIVIDKNGIVGDAHAGQHHRQVSILASEIVEKFCKENNCAISSGKFAENILVSGIGHEKIAIFDRLQIGDVELEITQIGKKCHGQGCNIFQNVGKCAMADEGIFCRVIRGGAVKPGDDVVLLPTPLPVKIMTISDRASRGEYEDKSGPRASMMLKNFFQDKPYRVQIQNILIPDDKQMIEDALTSCKRDNTTILITLGGTGLGPRDITPEIVSSFCEKTIPGIMEYIRAKYGAQNPNALLSRSIAGIMGKTIIFALPGSVRAVEEYLSEIFKILEHLILIMNNIDVHSM